MGAQVEFHSPWEALAERGEVMSAVAEGWEGWICACFPVDSPFRRPFDHCRAFPLAYSNRGVSRRFSCAVVSRVPSAGDGGIG